LAIGLRGGRIEFDVENFVCYIPQAAFTDETEQKAVLEQILGFWRAAKSVQP
jgi:hypothetical protein